MPLLYIQSDLSLLLDADHPESGAARFSIAQFAELVKTPGPLHHYRVTALSLWNAAATGLSAAEIVSVLERYSEDTLPAAVRAQIEKYVGSYGCVWIEEAGDDCLALRSADAALLSRLTRHSAIAPLLQQQMDDHTWLFNAVFRGALKQSLVELQQPADDRATYGDGAALTLALRDERVRLRDYQWEAIRRMHESGSGVVVLPCGAGKTVVGIGMIAAEQTNTLILAPGITAARQWAAELLDKTTRQADEIGEYSGERKEIRPVTIATYQMLTHALQSMTHRRDLSLFALNDWGLIIYDEVHLLPAPVFRLTAAIQTTKRLGLTATLVREDHREGDVFALVGPTRYQAGWKVLERAGWIAEARCYEVRVALDTAARLAYVQAGKMQQARIAGENAAKFDVVRRLVRRHEADCVLVIGQYIDQLERIAHSLRAPLIRGATPNPVRTRLYEQFRRGEVRLLVVSKVANYAVDLPDANVAIQVSGTFGSRQEEAQRLGRILRPKANHGQADFYSVVTQDTIEQRFAEKRQRFLVEQGYEYKIVHGKG